jgi:hypothetical protein
MCLPAQINTNAPTRIVPASAVQPSGSRQSRCEVVVVLLFRSNAGTRGGAVQQAPSGTSSSFAITQKTVRVG